MLPEPPISICHFFQAQSHYVWDRIGFARRMNVSVRETTITEELLYHFYQSFEAFNIPIRLFESKEEHRNGSDLEVLVNTGRGFILFACQAKITYKTGSYRKFHHEVGGARQIDLLLDYAARHGGIAQYMLYNFVPDWMVSAPLEHGKIAEDMGITHISASEIIDWMNSFICMGKKPVVPHYNTFHPGTAKPFHELICSLLTDNSAYLRMLPKEVSSGLTFYDENEVSDADTWRRISSLATIGYVDQQNVYAAQKEATDLVFSNGQKSKEPPSPPIFKPKFRLVIGGQDSGGAMYRIE